MIIMLFKRKSKEKELKTQDYVVHKFVIFNTDVIVAIDSIKLIRRDKNNVQIIYKSNAKVDSTVISYDTEESAKDVIKQLGDLLNLETVVL